MAKSKTPSLPLGQPESENLEFKGREALERPERVAREVVAMLNAEGGAVWIGVTEEGGVASGYEPIASPAQSEDRLMDFFVEKIEPFPTSEEVRISTVEIGEDSVLLVCVQPAEERRPYALLLRDGRAFLRRVGRRTIRMSREEVSAAFRSEAPRPDLSFLQQRKKEAIEAGEDILWFGLAPEPEANLDLHDQKLLSLLKDPTLSGNRVSGWTVMNRYTETQPRAGRVAQIAQGARWRLVLHSNGCLEFTAPLECLVHGKEPSIIYPYALLEYPTSLLRLASTILRESGYSDGRRAMFDLIMLGVDGWRLWAYGPKQMGYGEEFFAVPPRDEKTLALPKPLEFDAAQLIEEPEAFAWQVIRTVYEEFGYSEDKIPRQFDPITRRLRIGD